MATVFLLSMVRASVVSQTTVQSQSAPCPNEAQLQKETDRLCAELLPFDGVVRYLTKDGGACTCECAQLMDRSLKELDALRKARSERYRTNMLAFNKQLGGKPPFHGGSEPADASQADGAPAAVSDPVPKAMYLNGVLSCPADMELKDLIETDLAGLSLNYGSVFGYFTFNLKTEKPDCAGLFGLIREGTGYPVIDLSSTMVRHSTVDEEFMAFMLLHEIGHAVVDDSDTLTDCESEVDAWATRVGFLALYGSEYGTRLTRALAQMRAYYEANFKSSARARANGPRASCIGTYPALDCRIDLIRSIAMGTTAATSAGIDGYFAANAACWTGASSYTADEFIGTSHCGKCLKVAELDTVVHCWWCLPPGIDLPEKEPSLRTYFLEWSFLRCLIDPEECLKFSLLAEAAMIRPIVPPDKLTPDMSARARSLEKEYRRVMERTSSRLKALHREFDRLGPDPVQ